MGLACVPLAVASASAFAGCLAFAYVLTFLGLPITIAPSVYAVAAATAMSSPMIAVFGIFAVPVRA